jgi:hypothetical protein
MTRSAKAVILTGAVALVPATACLAAVSAVHSARAARTISARDTAHLHPVSTGEEWIVEEGRAWGTLPGTVKATLTIGPSVVAKFTIRAAYGSLSGTGTGTPHGRPAEPSFSGTMTITHGTGRYLHARGHGGFYGTLNREKYTAVVQTTGTLSY